MSYAPEQPFAIPAEFVSAMNYEDSEKSPLVVLNMRLKINPDKPWKVDRLAITKSQGVVLLENLIMCLGSDPEIRSGALELLEKCQNHREPPIKLRKR